MRIHTNHLTGDDLHYALKMAAVAAPDVELIVQGEHGSRSHRRAFEIALRGTGKRHTKRPNGGHDGYAATYDDWGWVISAIMGLESTVTAGPYKGADDFDRQTKNRYTI